MQRRIIKPISIVPISKFVLITMCRIEFFYPPRQPLPHHFCRPRFQQAQTWSQRFMQLVMRRIEKNRLTNSWFKCWIWQTMLSLSFMLVMFEVRKMKICVAAGPTIWMLQTFRACRTHLCLLFLETTTGMTVRVQMKA
jgi:hypothetical protein